MLLFTCTVVAHTTKCNLQLHHSRSLEIVRHYVGCNNNNYYNFFGKAHNTVCWYKRFITLCLQ